MLTKVFLLINDDDDGGIQLELEYDDEDVCGRRYESNCAAAAAAC